MNSQFMPQFAPFVVLAFLGTCFLLAVTALVFVVSLLLKKWKVSKVAFLGGCAAAGVYLLLLLGTSLLSQEKVLTSAAKKYFCEIDCHIAYSVESVTEAKVLGTTPQQATASGKFYVVKIKTWFDEKTISSRRGNGLLHPNPRRVVIVDDQGREYAPSANGLSILQHDESNWTPLTQSLRPGESYTTNLVFDLPDGVHNLRLFITDADVVTNFLIGHENSPLHKKIYFGLDVKSNSAGL